MNEIIKWLIAKGLVVTGKALLHILPTVPPRSEEAEPDELDLLIFTALEMVTSEMFQVLSIEEQQQYHHHMAEIIKLFIEDEDDDDGECGENNLPPSGPDVIEEVEEFLKLARV